jgi:hypothetical protein
MALTVIDIGDIGDWFVESINWGLPIFAQPFYDLVSKPALIIFLLLTQLIIRVIVIDVNYTAVAVVTVD